MRHAYGRCGMVSACALLFLAGGCAHTEFERGAFESLMRMQCESAEARGTCNRSFAQEFSEWQDRREAYLAELEAARMKDPGWPGVLDNATLPDL